MAVIFGVILIVLIVACYLKYRKKNKMMEDNVQPIYVGYQNGQPEQVQVQQVPPYLNNQPGQPYLDNQPGQPYQSPAVQPGAYHDQMSTMYPMTNTQTHNS